MQTQEAKPEEKVKTEAVKPKKEKKPPSEEEIRAAVAGVMLEEVELWPEEVRQVIGKDHPNKDGFSKGVPYVIGAYTHIARKKTNHAITRKVRAAELETASKLSGVVGETNALRLNFNSEVKRDLEQIEKDRKKALAAATQEINAKFNAERTVVEARLPEGRFAELIKEEVAIKVACDEECDIIRQSYGPLLAKIEQVEASAENWNSKKRQAKRDDAKPKEEEVKDDA